MRIEAPYEFRKTYSCVHKRIYNWKTRTVEADELQLQDGVTISCSADGEVAKTALKDFCDYLKTAFGIKASIVPEGGVINVKLDPAMTDYMARKITVTANGVQIAAADERGLAQALYHLEDEMNRRQAPFLKHGTVDQKPAFSPRMVHSGIGVDLYPDGFLSAIAHNGFDAILVFVRDLTHAGLKDQEYDFNDTIKRAAKYGLDVYAYNYVRNFVHPDDPGAKETFDRSYGDVFRAFPGLKGMVFVGESIQFPTKDPNASPVHHLTPPADGIPDRRPRSGWWPCYDYIDWISMARDSIREVKPDADVVLWSYNWGRQPLEPRVALLEKLPTDISLLVTFEMYDLLDLGNSVGMVNDYTISHVGPGKYFVSEAEVAKRRGLRLYAMVNTAGRTWDFGVIPYEPFPWQWHERHEKILECREKYGLCGLMEAHHFGFCPSFISQQAKQAYTIGGRDFEDYLTGWAKTLAGDEYETLMDAMKSVNKGIHCYVPSHENQYGPYRIGPAFPFCIKAGLKKPNTSKMYMGNSIYVVRDLFRDPSNHDPYSMRVHDELSLAKQAMKHTFDGLKKMKTIKKKTPELKKLMDLVEFIGRCHRTAVHYKEFYILRARLLACPNREEIFRIADRIMQIGRKEIKNAEDTIPLVQRNSELGYEPAMDYQCDEEGLRWKIKQMDYMLNAELNGYKRRPVATPQAKK